MAVDVTDAARALGEIEETSGRVTRRQGYREASPHFIMWGLVWLFGNGALEVLPWQTAQYVMAALIAAAVIGAIVLGVRQGRPVPGETSLDIRARKRAGMQINMVILLAYALVIGAVTVFWPVEYRDINAFISLVAGLVYIGAGVVAGWRWIAVGGAVVALTLIGHLLLEQYYYAWMAVVGGGALILGGLWLRKA